MGVATGQVSQGQSTVSIELAITTDNGASWRLVQPSLQSTSTGSSWPSAPQLYAHVTASHKIWLLLSPQVATMGGHAPVWVSYDDGRTFRNVPLPAGYQAMGGFSDHGYVALSTYDTITQQYGVLVGNGVTPWAKLGPNSETPIYAVDYVDSTQIYAGGGNIAKYGIQPAQEIWSLHPDNPQNIAVILRRNGTHQESYQPIVELDIHPTGQSYILTGGAPMGANLPAPGPLFTSSDGGMHLHQTTASGSSFDILNAQAWVASPGIGLVVSSDGGNTWQAEFRPTTVQAQSVQFVNQEIGYVTTQVGVYGTMDGGTHWTHLPIQVSPYRGQWLQFVTRTRMYRWSQTSIELSTDGGVSWRPLVIPAVEQIDGFSALPNGVLKLSGLPVPHTSNHPFDDDLFTTTDDGVHWSKVSDPFHIQGVALAFSSPALGVARAPQLSLKVGSRPASLFVTTDGGQHWQAIGDENVSGEGINALSVNLDGLAISGAVNSSESPNGQTPSAGIIVIANPSLTEFQAWDTGPNLPESLSYPGHNDIWLVANGQVFHTTDGGQTFQHVWLTQ
ncbi:MAG: hypothetical protein A2201_12105 [Alicyclobacillus sp. RIFOXYA1_FULL_53_8]|nr:MAG: hypothetical protein A2201_12105 [Alicyclobacillus sp. RIFOXYA1_FULL_53_8]